jgi:seryl-tRNA synthetase
MRTRIDKVASELARRAFDLDVSAFEDLDGRRKKIQTLTQSLQNQRNKRSSSIGRAKAAGGDIQLLLKEVEDLGDKLRAAEAELSGLQEQIQDFMLGLPNTLDDAVPAGKTEDDNVEISRWGEPTEFDFEAMDHVELGTRLQEMDFEVAAKLASARFVTLQGGLAAMHRALIQFMLDTHVQEHGYTEVYVPYLVNSDSMRGTGQLPKFEEELFAVRNDPPLYLIPTAEVPVTNLVRDTITEDGPMPLRFVAHTPCFRSEAGSYGKDVRGMIRQHQFEKVELVQIVRPGESEAGHEELTGHAESILQRLELPYRKVLLCAGDTGFSSSKTYDLEVWLPGQNKYREISSCSNFRDFQARRLSARWRNPETGKPELVHTVNGSGLAVGRALIAVMENYQKPDGCIRVPKVLQSYLGGREAIG